MTSSSAASSIRLGSYQLFERLGEGASGQVYRATTDDGTACAVKVLRPGGALDDAARARFKREARALAEVRAPELVRLLDSGVDDELGPWLALPLVPGTTVRAIGRVCPEAAILLALPIARAAAALHAAGFVHRDLKPDNAIATPSGEIVVIDLGLAWAEGMSRWTEEGAAVGSVGYMAPEQIEGATVGAPADVWAIGVILYELVAGKRPFARARATEEAAAALVGACSPLGAVERRCGDELASIVARCLARDPSARPTAAALAEQLEGLIDWTDTIGDDRAAVIADPIGYATRVAPFRARRLERLAKEAVAAKRPFAALAMLDRALAYAEDAAAKRGSAEALSSSKGRAEPEGRGRGVAPRAAAGIVAELSALVAEVETAAAAIAPPKDTTPDLPRAVKPRSPWRAMIATALVAAAGATAVTWLLTRSQSSPAPQAAPPPVTLASIDAAPASPDPALGDPELTGSPLAQLPPIPLDRLKNDDKPFKLDLAAAAGEPLVPTSLLGGRTPDEAIAAVDAALARDPGDQEALVGQAMIYIAAGRTKQGLQLLDEAMRLHPKYAAGWAMKSFVEVRRGRWDAAEQAFARALELDPQDSKSLTNRGIMRHRLGHIRDAYQDLRAALAIDPRENNALYELVQLYQRNGRADEIGPILERIVQLDPDNATAWLDLSQTQEPRKAKVSVERALALDPTSVRGLDRRCNVLAMLEDPGTRDACDQAIAADGGVEAEMFADRGMTRYKAGDDAGALEDLDRAVKLDDQTAQYLVDRAIVHLHAGHRDQAHADLDRACKLGDRGACAELANGPRKDAANVVP
ncbi:MAG TPA: protein kinase [Kofleriaceae bacterium]|nr:protein kinase [Kofleriaceae bacterium]